MVMKVRKVGLSVLTLESLTAFSLPPGAWILDHLEEKIDQLLSGAEENRD
jgi:hypothetical protein